MAINKCGLYDIFERIIEFERVIKDKKSELEEFEKHPIAKSHKNMVLDLIRCEERIELIKYHCDHIVLLNRSPLYEGKCLICGKLCINGSITFVIPDRLFDFYYIYEKVREKLYERFKSNEFNDKEFQNEIYELINDLVKTQKLIK